MSLFIHILYNSLIWCLRPMYGSDKLLIWSANSWTLKLTFSRLFRLLQLSVLCHRRANNSILDIRLSYREHVKLRVETRRRERTMPSLQRWKIWHFLLELEKCFLRKLWLVRWEEHQQLLESSDFWQVWKPVRVPREVGWAPKERGTILGCVPSLLAVGFWFSLLETHPHGWRHPHSPERRLDAGSKRLVEQIETKSSSSILAPNNDDDISA